MRIRTRAVLGLLSLATAGAVVATAAPAQAAVAIPLPLPAFFDVEVSRSHVFISGGPQSNEIVVTDLNGTEVRRIPGQAGALGLALSRDGRTLYAALKGTGAISAIDTRTLRERTRWVTGVCPVNLAVTDRLWFGYGCSGDWQGGIGSIDVGSANPTVKLNQQGAHSYYGAPSLVAPRAGNLLLAANPVSPPTVQVFGQAADGTLTERVAKRIENSSGVNDWALTRDGTTLYMASGAPYEIQAFAVADLSPRGQLATTPYPSAVALSPNDDRIAGGSDATYDPDVYVFGRDGTRQATLELGYGLSLQRRGLAWAPDGRRLFAVTAGYQVPPALHVLRP